MRGSTSGLGSRSALSENDEPEPDLAVVSGAPRDYAEDHPSTAVLVVEVAETSLAFDRGVKKALYAEFGIPEYWIVDVIERVVEIHRSPQGAEYRERSSPRPYKQNGRPARADRPGVHRGLESVRGSAGCVA